MQAYNPRLQQWSVEEPLTNPKHKACAVAIDNSLVITGGTMLGKKKKSILITHYVLHGVFFFQGWEKSNLYGLQKLEVEQWKNLTDLCGPNCHQ